MFPNKTVTEQILQNSSIEKLKRERLLLIEALENRIKELNEADAEFCKDRWERPEIHAFKKQIAREESNKVTFARQELESILKIVKSKTNQP